MKDLTKLDRVERAIGKVLDSWVDIEIQPNGLPNRKWVLQHVALRNLKRLSLKYHKEL